MEVCVRKAGHLPKKHQKTIDAEQQVRRCENEKAAGTKHICAVVKKRFGVDNVLDDLSRDDDIEFLVERKRIRGVVFDNPLCLLRLYVDAEDIPSSQPKLLKEPSVKTTNLEDSAGRHVFENSVDLPIERMMLERNASLRPLMSAIDLINSHLAKKPPLTGSRIGAFARDGLDGHLLARLNDGAWRIAHRSPANELGRIARVDSAGLRVSQEYCTEHKNSLLCHV
jgi:hypothetical protein